MNYKNEEAKKHDILMIYIIYIYMHVYIYINRERERIDGVYVCSGFKTPRKMPSCRKRY